MWLLAYNICTLYVIVHINNEKLMGHELLFTLFILIKKFRILLPICSLSAFSNCFYMNES